MTSKYFAISVFCIIIFNSCNKRTTHIEPFEIISINPYEADEYFNLSEIVDSVKCIKLQTDSDNIMGRVREIIIKKKYIYAADISQQALYVFDKTGKYISKLDKVGQGPDEYVHMGPIFIDNNEEYVEIINLRGSKTVKMKYTNISFNLIDKSEFPDISCNSCKRNSDFYYHSTQQLDNIINDKKTNANLIIIDNSNNESVLFDKNIKTNNSTFSPNSESFSQNDKDELFISLMYDNTFYKLDSTKASPIFTIDFGKHGINNLIGSKSTEKQLKYIMNTNNLATFPVLNINNSNIMSFSYYFKQDKKERMYREEDFRQYLKINSTNKIYHFKRIKNDITDFPTHVYLSSYFFNCVHEVWNEDYLVDIILPHNYIHNETEEIIVNDIGKISAFDNPIIVMMKLKQDIL